MTADELAERREKMDAQREDVRTTLAEDLGGDPDDCRADHPVPDGSE